MRCRDAEGGEVVEVGPVLPCGGRGIVIMIILMMMIIMIVVVVVVVVIMIAITIMKIMIIIIIMIITVTGRPSDSSVLRHGPRPQSFGPLRGFSRLQG